MATHKKSSISFHSIKEVLGDPRINIVNGLYKGRQAEEMRKNSVLIGLGFVAMILLLVTVTPGRLFKASLVDGLRLSPKDLPVISDPEPKASAQEPKAETGVKEPKTTPAEVQAEPSPTPEHPAVESVAMPSAVKGVYVTGWIAGAPKSMAGVIRFIDQTEVNSVVIDIKDDTGTLSYKSNVPMVLETKASEQKIPDIVTLLKTLKEHNIYPIARIVVFKDPHLAAARPDWAVKDKNGGYWKDRNGLKWVDPNNKEVWKYTVDIAEEAMAYGFKEIQFDYVRFTSDGVIKNCVYPYSDGTTRADVIKNFLTYAKDRLKKYNAVLSADVFGLTCSVEDDLGIGQKLEKVGGVVDVLSPMVYPSHYYKGTYGLANPDLAPYETITHTMKDANKKLAGMPVRMRPWLQDFNLPSHYGREQLLAQIKALNDQGIHDWLFWNPNCNYKVEKYNAN